MKIEHSFYSHVTDEEIYQKANSILNRGVDINIEWEEFMNGASIRCSLSDLTYYQEL